jgi:acetyl-CoA carboxylase biotin carboxylase subunit
MREAGVPVLPGSESVLTSSDEALSVAKEIGYPVILKASAGGGGRGMRIVNEASELPALFVQAQQEAGAAFGCPDVYLEKYIRAPRHIEFQVLGDEYGKVEALGERECTIQRRHQKLLEESPSPVLTPRVREEISAKVTGALSAAGYSNAGTVEFLMDEDGRLYFIEVNARIQVEHPVTEMVTGLDLVKSQIMLASGATLPQVVQQPVRLNGHALECRINAEHPVTFAPSPGRITALNLPGGIGVRVDTAVYADGIITPYYDSLVAKLVTHGQTREESIARMRRALDMFVVEGIHTSIPLHKRILASAEFQSGQFDTGFIRRFLEAENGGGRA